MCSAKSLSCIWRPRRASSSGRNAKLTMNAPEAFHPVNPTVREAQSIETYNPLAKQKAAAKLSRIPVKVAPGELLKKFKALHPDVPTKSGIMVGLGETDEEILQVMRDLRAHGINMLSVGQYLAPSSSHLPVRRYVPPDTFKMLEEEAYKMGFSHAAVGAMVRSSYHADQQAGQVLASL